MLSPELLSRIKHLELKAKHLASDLLFGEYVSAFKGRGWEFDRVRVYNPGDDWRAIDWNVSARMGEPYVKIFQEEREMTMLLLLDVSSSLYYASQHRPKHELAAELCAVLAFLAIRGKDKVGLLLFSGEVEHYLPPSKGRTHVWDIMRAVLGHKTEGKSTDLSAALTFLFSVHKRRSLVFLISDFHADQSLLSQLAARHDLVCICVHDPSEEVWPDAGVLALEDKESGERVVINSSDAGFRAAWRAKANDRIKEWQKR